MTVDNEIDTGEPAHMSSSNNISPGYFETLGIPLIAGRYFDETDRAVENVRTMASLLKQDRSEPRLNAILFGGFSLLALVIAALGVFSTLAFSVSQRVRKFGIRMAFGADEGSVLRDVMGEGALVVGVALLIGFGGALLLARLMAGLLFAVEPLDPLSFAGAAGALGIVALIAALLPALRATRIDPADALRAE